MIKNLCWFGEVGMAAILAGIFTVPLGIFMAGRTEITLAFIGTAVLFLPKLIQRAMKVDADAVIGTFGKNEQVKKVFWSLFIVIAGLVLGQILDADIAEQVIQVIVGR